MATLCGALTGKVVFITGASRGIGRAIALKAAQDGSKIVIAAKTAETHPKLPGTIYTVAEEIKKLGGECLPCTVDIRHEDSVESAVNQTVKVFGGIDVLVNNASAISLTNTSDTPMKKFDLMMSVNGRGTYLCSKLCLPHLKKSSDGGRIVNISPPLNLDPCWFSNHAAYTITKYGMSMCVLGMASEFQRYNIAVNALWPRTAIYTSAMKMLMGENIMKHCRKPEIVADAAYVLLSRPPSYTGNFCIDEEILQSEGVTDFKAYDMESGNRLMPDFFLDSTPTQMMNEFEKLVSDKTSPYKVDLDATFRTIQAAITDDVVEQTGSSYLITIDGGENEQRWFLNLKDKPGSITKVGHGTVEGHDCELEMSSKVCVGIFDGKIQTTDAFMSGSLNVIGSPGAALKLQKICKQLLKS